MRKIKLNIVLTLCFLFILELLGQIAYKLQNGHFLINEVPELTAFYEEHPYLSVSLKKNAQINFREQSIRTNDQGFRVTSYPDIPVNSSQKVIVCLGGSTTFSTMVSDEDSWPFMLQQQLGPNYKVYNLGSPGYSSMEAIIQMTMIVPELQPDIIINYHGWNDIHNYHIENPSPDYFQHGMFLKQALPTKKSLIYYLKHSAIFFYTGFFNEGKTLASDGNPVPEVNSYTTPDSYQDSLYVRNINTLNLLGESLGAVNIFVPQIINVESFINSEYPSRSWTKHIRDKSMPDLLQRFNQLMSSSLVIDNNTIVLNEEVKFEQWPAKYFVDDGHFNKEGNLKFSKMIFQIINSEE